jgi:hypothetical protein
MAASDNIHNADDKSGLAQPLIGGNSGAAATKRRNYPPRPAGSQAEYALLFKSALKAEGVAIYKS